MQLKYMKTLLPQQDGAAKITALAWAPNNTKLAVCTSERVILLYDDQGERKDKFSTKPVDAKYGKKSYVVKGLAFSPDSNKIAVGQTDCIIFVYKIGDSWTEKKVICNKFIQQSAVTCLAWPTERGIVFGLADGKVRLANVKTNKSSTIYATSNYVVSIAPSADGKGFLTGHAEGSIVRYFYDDSGIAEPSQKVCTHPCPPYCLVWSPNAIVAAGCDKRVISYNREGRLQQQFDYSREEDEREFSTAAVSPSGQSVVVSSYDRFRIFNWSNRKGAWEEGKTKDIPHLYTITTLAWKYDGSRLIAGALCGNVEMFDCCIKRSVLKNKFEVIHVGPSQAIVRNIATGKNAIVKSGLGLEIDDVKVLGKDRFVVAHTTETLLVADIETGRASEVIWQSGGNEKFYFDAENVCMIFNAGELCLVEYGNNEILGSVRTEFMNPHMISVRLNERKYKASEDVKRIAYLVDLKTICIMDLLFGTTICTISHDSKIDWLELNETARKLLFRDKRYRLQLHDIDADSKVVLLPYCSYVQWVPGSDVVVAQSRNNMCVWYNIEASDQVTMTPIKGDIIEVSREEGRTEVVVNEGSQHMAYPLDEGLIEFGTAMDDADFIRAIQFLENLPLTPETDSMWRQLAKTSLEHKQLLVVERCYAALGDIARTRYLHETREMAKQAAKQIGGDGTQYYKVRARFAIMERQFKEAERIYLEQNCLDEAIEMYQELHKWDEALELAEARGHADAEQLKIKYYRHLAETGQDEKAGELREKEGDYMAAIDFYLKANLPSRAARVVVDHQNLLSNAELLQTIAIALIKNELFERAGDLFEKVKDFDRALECYRRGKAFNRAVELARYAFPQEVVKLEDEWGDHLAQEKQIVAAVNHYIESGNTLKALEAAVKSRQWQRAIEIVEVLDQPELAKEYYGKIAHHYASVLEFDRAERFFIEAGLAKEAIEMYNKAGKWDDAHRLASEFLKQEETSNMYMTQAKALETQGRFREAEKLYIAINKPNLAINMYKEAGQHDQMMRLVEQHFGEKAEDTRLHLAKEMESSGNLRAAEQQYISAKDWKTAVNMYRNAGQWEDAYRIAKQYGTDVAPKQVAYLWAKSLGGDSAVKLLQKFGMLDEAVDYASDNNAFDFAFELCRLGLKSKLPAVHLKYALHLEEESRYKEAEQHFIEAGRGKEATLMYVDQQDWDNAQRVAEKHAPEAINDVYIGQARLAFEQRDYQKAETFLLRAQKPDIIVKSYKELGMWHDALRVCKEYLPHIYPQLQDEFDVFNLKSGAKGAQSFMAQAKDWESQNDYLRAVECYLKVNSTVTQDRSLMERAWTKAGELTVKFLMSQDAERAATILQEVAQNLQDIRNFNAAAELYLEIDMVKEAINALVAGAEWKKAKKVAAQMAPELEGYVDDKYKEFLKSGGKTEELASVDVVGAIEEYIKRGQWDKALDIAKQQNPALLDKYVTQYAVEKLKDGKAMDAIEVFVKFGAAANEQNFNLYKKLTDDIINSKGLDGAEGYKTWAALRDMLLDLCEKLQKDDDKAEKFDARYLEIFDRYLLIAHSYALRAALINEGSLKPYAVKITVSLLRHTDLIPADKAFYEAGMFTKDQGGSSESMAFVFLNHYLDLAEAIEEKNPDMVDYGDFLDTDIPTEIPLPAKLHLSANDHEEVKEWVLAVSVDKQIERVLPKDRRGVYEASLLNSDGSMSEACLVTGYPVLGTPIKFGDSGRIGNKDDWTKFQMTTKMSRNPHCQDVMSFIGRWTKSSLATAF